MKLSALGRVDGIPTHEILHGLGQIHELVLVSDTHGRIVWMSDALEMICGGVENLVGREVAELLTSSPPDVELPRSIDKQLVELREQLDQNDLATDFQLDLGIRHGQAVRLDVSAFRVDRHVEGEQDETLNVAIVHPIREREDDLTLRTTLDFLGSMLDASPTGAMAIDQSGFITYVNPAFAAILGRDPSDLLEQPVAMLLPLTCEKRQARWHQLVEAVDEDGVLHEQVIEIRRATGKLAWVAISAGPLRPRGHDQPSGSLGSGSVVHLRDVTTEYEEIERLERQNAELESYVDSVSHDLRSPLVSLLGFTRLLKQDYGRVIDATGAHFLDRVEQAGRSMQNLIQDLLELSRIGKSGEIPRLVDPRSVLLQIQAELKLRLDEAGVSLCLPASPPLVYIDRTRLYQLFSNLIGNALKHMGPCDEPRIQVEIVERHGFHQLSVRDNGLGIDADAQQRIFEVFQTARRSRSDSRSTGMGLAIVRKIAESHGGKAWVESEPERGAAFHVTLPRH